MTKNTKKFFAIVETDCGEELASSRCKTWDEAKDFLLDAIDGDFHDEEFTEKVRATAIDSLCCSGMWEFPGVYCNEHDSGRNWETCRIKITGADTKLVTVPDNKPVPKKGRKIK